MFKSPNTHSKYTHSKFTRRKLTHSKYTHSKYTRRQFTLRLLQSALGAIAVTIPGVLGAQSPQPLRIGIIGSGNIGGAVGLRWAAAGHHILFSSRNPDELAELVQQASPNARAGMPIDAVEFGDVIFIAVPYAALPQVGRDFAAMMQGKIVIDCGNPYPRRDGEMAQAALDKGTGVASAEYLPGVRLVRAFNAIGYQSVHDKHHRDGALVAIPIAGDDQAAVAVTVNLVIDAGFEPVVVGALARAREFDQGSAVYVQDLTAAELRAALQL